MNRYFLLVVVLIFSHPAFAQWPGPRGGNLVLRETVKPNWLAGGKSFWYRVQTGPNSFEYVHIDCETGKRRTGKDLTALDLPAEDKLKSSELATKIRPSARTGEESGLKFVNKLDYDVDLFWINPEGERVRYEPIRAGGEREQHSFDGHVWLLTGKAGEQLAVVEVAPTIVTVVIDGKGVAESREAPRRGPGLGRASRSSSPDGKYNVTIENGRSMLRNRKSEESRELKTDLPAELVLREPVQWAPDSSAFVVTACADVPRRKITIVDSSPKDQLQPKLKELDYNKPGDPLPEPVPVLFRLTDDGHVWHKLDSPLLKNPYSTSTRIDVRWADDSSEFYFDHNQRGHQAYRLIAANGKTGAVRAVAEETTQTFIDYTNKIWRHWLPETGELLWMSERDGWCHVYLIEVKSGEVKNPVTQGKWVVRRIVHVDEDARELWFMASGLVPGEDPYHQHLCRVNFEGNGFQQLTQGDGQHRIEFSPDRRYFIDTWSRVDLPPVHELRRSSDGELITTLEKANADRLVGSGWTMPERFVAKGRDGETDIYGVIIKPKDFDPAKKYPVLEQAYAGPQSAYVPKEFNRFQRHHDFAERGFIVVQVDGMGTNFRSKAFHDVCWKNLKDAGFPDRIAWIKAAAATRPWMDLERVGIYGGSAGGQNAMRALLDHHDFYKVAVADCGCHDNRLDKLWWNEQWHGWPVDDSYAKSSNMEDAGRLQGKLLLIVGELDTNVDPASTMQVVGALQRAGKIFEYAPIVGAGHGAAETAYGSRLRREFLERHLQP